MTARELLRQLRQQGAIFSINGDKLRIRNVDHLLTDDLKAALLFHKPELMQLVQLPICQTCGDPMERQGSYTSPVRRGKYWCGNEKCLAIWLPVSDPPTRPDVKTPELATPTMAPFDGDPTSGPSCECGTVMQPGRVILMGERGWWCPSATCGRIVWVRENTANAR